MAIPKSKRSGGPKTSSGKLNASKNALKTGAYTSTIVLPGESEEDFEKLHQQFMNDFIPSDVAESAMVYELAGLTWKKLRLEKLEHAAFIRSINLNITIKDMASEGIEVDKYHEKHLKELNDNKTVELFITKSWTTITKKFGFNTPHHHNTNTVVGVYYVKTSDKCGDLLLHDPRGAMSFIEKFEINTQGHLVSGRSYYRITPKIGDLILFPAYIVHSVDPNMSDDERISVALNFYHKDFNQFKPE